MLLYRKCRCLWEHWKESCAVTVTQLLWHYCAVQMQGFSIFLTAWQTHSNPQSLSLLILPDKGAHKARMGCSVPSIPGQYLSLQTQTCQLTSPGLMSLRALSWSRKLLSGKDASALGMQLWLPGHKGATGGERESSEALMTRETVFQLKRQSHGRRLHSHELWSRNSPEPSQFRKSPVSTEKGDKQRRQTLRSNQQLHKTAMSLVQHEKTNKETHSHVQHDIITSAQLRQKWFTPNNTARLR